MQIPTSDTVEIVALDKLRPVEWNTQERTEEELQRIKDSIVAHGFIVPIVARPSDGSIAGGHGRLRAVEELLDDGYELAGNGIPTVWHECDDAELRSLNMALNNAMGQPNMEKVGMAIREIEKLGRDDLLEQGATGFSAMQVKDIKTLVVREVGGQNVDAERGWEQYRDDELADELAESDEGDDDYQWSELTFSITDDMREVIDDALVKARKLSESDNDAVALTNICADFLGTPDKSFE